MMTIPVWAVVAAVAVAVALYVRLLLHYRRNTRKVAFMFDAIDNNDLSFAFNTSGVPTDDALLNRSLNRIKLVLAHARDEAVEREKYYEQIMDAAGTGLLVIDAAGHILQHNHAATVLLQRQVLTHLDQVRSRLDDGTLSLRETYTTLRGERVRIIAVSDINSELANREVDSWIKLIRVLTHEIMNTITPITSLSQTLLCKATGEQREGLETISRTGSELMAFVDNYRRFTHVPQPQPKLFYVKPFAERMARLAPCEVEVNVCPADLLVYADEGLMARVMSNLLKNAAEAVCAADEVHGSQGRKVWIDAYTGSDDSVVIDISDNGSPIPEECRDRIFVPFFTTKQNGSGIGLAVARRVLSLHDGGISLIQPTDAPYTKTFRMSLL